MNSQNTAGVGGGIPVVEPIHQHSPMHPAPLYQSHDETLTSRRAEFQKLLACIAQTLRPFAVTGRERSVCDEVTRGRSLSIAGLDVLCTLLARSDRPFALEELIQRTVVQRIASPVSLSPLDTFLDETRAQAKADVAQALFIAERGPARRDQAIDALSEHEHAIEVAKESLIRWPSRGRA